MSEGAEVVHELAVEFRKVLRKKNQTQRQNKVALTELRSRRAIYQRLRATGLSNEVIAFIVTLKLLKMSVDDFLDLLPTADP